MGDARKLLDVENGTARVRDGLAKQCLRVRTEGSLNLLLRGILIDEGTLNAQLLQRHAEEIVGATINLVGGNEVVAGLADVEHGIEVGSLTRRGQHSPYPTLKGGNLRGNGIVRRILQAGVEVPLLLQVEEHGHLFRVIILERGTLDNRQLYRFAVLGLVPCMNTERAFAQFLFHIVSAIH